MLTGSFCNPSDTHMIQVLAFKLGDMAIRGSYVYLTPDHWTYLSTLFVIEMAFGVILPFVMMLSSKVRNDKRLLFIAALLIVLGVAFNRLNVMVFAYQPPYATKTYFPSFDEFAVTIGLVCCLMLIYRAIVTYLPVISHPELAREK